MNISSGSSSSINGCTSSDINFSCSFSQGLTICKKEFHEPCCHCNGAYCCDHIGNHNCKRNAASDHVDSDWTPVRRKRGSKHKTSPAVNSTPALNTASFQRTSGKRSLTCKSFFYFESHCFVVLN